MKYTTAYMDIRPIVGKRFTKAMPERTMKLFKAAHSKRVQIVVS